MVPTFRESGTLVVAEVPSTKNGGIRKGRRIDRQAALVQQYIRACKRHIGEFLAHIGG